VGAPRSFEITHKDNPMEIKIEDIILNKIVTDLDLPVMVLEGLQDLGYDKGFELHGLKLRCRENKKYYRQVDLIVEEIYSIEDTSMSSKEFSIYALRHRFENIKGIFMAL
jgi:hypothetical protein